MRDCDRVQHSFERFLPELQKAVQCRKIWAEVVVLPDVGLQQPGMVGPTVKDVCCGKPISSKLFLKILHHNWNP